MCMHPGPRKKHISPPGPKDMPVTIVLDSVQAGVVHLECYLIFSEIHCTAKICMQAQLMHAQAQPYLIGPTTPPLPECLPPPPQPPWITEVRLSLSMHELSLSLPEPMLTEHTDLGYISRSCGGRRHSNPKAKLTSPCFRK